MTVVVVIRKVATLVIVLVASRGVWTSCQQPFIIFHILQIDMVGAVRRVVVLMMLGLCAGEYIRKSILCDDIDAICEYNGYPDENNKTSCGNDQEEFLNPVICNCGTKCIDNLKEGDSCVVSSPVQYPRELCGPGLECIPDDLTKPDDAHCIRNPARPCINERLEYEADKAAGTLGPGRYKPNCDEYGRYAPKQCTPASTCYCTNSDGMRLFGEGPITDQEKINCECSAYWDETKKKGLNFGLRCLPNGNFDSLQCFDDICFCYDAVNMTVLVGPLPFSMLLNMPCYDPTIHNPEYLNPCHKAQVEWDSQGDNDSIIVGENSRPICSPDGYYAAVQYHGPDAYCADINGNQIENFTQPIYLATDMKCCKCMLLAVCRIVAIVDWLSPKELLIGIEVSPFSACLRARGRYIMEENGLGASKPICLGDGHYRPWQTRGLMAYCVDANGNQKGEEFPFTSLEDQHCDVKTSK
ncbi:uncharacterized protein LOC121870326 [Homarus americanus]|uniref:uncharacterized protein LOC121870326 n=1 Tax=Homarus americanus TaxID=6706 RepID=UPI001C472886|nr:uncharacterized protein LOC121870326 [Homarus americanus]